MPITTRCDCGKKSVVADALAGATIRCSACGNNVFVGASAPSAKSPAAAKAARQKAAAGPAISVNPAIIITAVVGGLLLVTGLVLYFGPWTVGNKWAEIKPKANRDVSDVIDFAVRAYSGQHGMFDVSQSHQVPHIDGDPTFIPPAMAFHMPERIIFSGKSSVGNYIGTWNTTTGEVIADVEYGGMTVGGQVDLKKAEGKFHLTGREKGSVITAEADGTPLQMVVPKPHRRGE
jgi:hypothetical protein